MERIDAHQHFWKFDPIRDSWINDDMKLIQKDFTPVDLMPLLHHNGFSGSVIVQSDQSEEENFFQLNNADRFHFIKGVVGWVDLQSNRVEERLEYYAQFKKMKGFRHVLQGETDRALMLQTAFKNGISLLKKYGFTYDVLIFPDQLKYAYELAKEFPEQPFVIDHLAKPLIKDQVIDEWKKDMEAIAACENVYCKISGMVTEADWNNWKETDFTAYLDVVTNAFGINRVMFGSDWPVCLVAGGYEKMLSIVQNYFAAFSIREQEKFFGQNAIEFYKL